MPGLSWWIYKAFEYRHLDTCHSYFQSIARISTILFLRSASSRTTLDEITWTGVVSYSRSRFFVSVARPIESVGRKFPTTGGSRVSEIRTCADFTIQIVRYIDIS